MKNISVGTIVELPQRLLSFVLTSVPPLKYFLQYQRSRTSTRFLLPSYHTYSKSIITSGASHHIDIRALTYIYTHTHTHTHTHSHTHEHTRTHTHTNAFTHKHTHIHTHTQTHSHTTHAHPHTHTNANTLQVIQTKNTIHQLPKQQFSTRRLLWVL